MTKQQNYQIGKLGETLARDYLVKKNYRLVATNFRTRFGEIDLVASKNNKLIFVEVKLKIGQRFGSPEEMINLAKLAKVKKMAQVFLQKHAKLKAQYPRHQIDTICIVLNQDRSIFRINHWENIDNEIG